MFHAELAGAPVGSLIPVRYDPDDHCKVEIDLERGRAKLEGRGPVSEASRIQESVEQINTRAAGISAATNDIAETMEAIKRAKDALDTAEVERLKPEFARRSQERQGS